MPELITPIDLLSDITASKARLAFFTTFSLDLAFFESEVFQALQTVEKDVQTVVLVDRSAYLETALSGRFVRKAESEYRFLPFTPPGQTFHPKVFFLAGEDWARLYVGSANLTRTGFSRNLEIVDRLETSLESPRHGECFKAFAGFVKDLVSNGAVPANAAKSLESVRAAAQRFGGGTDDKSVVFGSSFSRPLWEEIKKHAPSDCEEVIIASPFHDPRHDALLAVGRQFPKAKLSLIVSDGPTSINPAYPKEIKNRVHLVSFKSTEARRRFLHAKTYLFRGRTQSLLVAGSANFTTPGFLSTTVAGNVETWTLRSGRAKAFEHLFSGPYHLQPTKVAPEYVPMESSAVRVEHELQIDHAAYDDSASELRVVLKAGKLRGQVDAIARIEGYLGKFTLTQRLKLEKSELTARFEVGPADARKLAAPATLTLETSASGKVLQSAPVWIELVGMLSLDSRARRIRDALADLEEQVLRDGRPQDRRGIDRILRALGDWLRETASDAGDAPCGAPRPGGGGGESAGPNKNIPMDWEDDAPSGETRGLGRVHLLSEMVAVLRRLGEQDPKHIRRLMRAGSATAETDEEAALTTSDDEPWMPDAELLEDYRYHFDEMLELLDQLPPKPNSLNFGLRTLECLAHLSFLLNVVIMGSDERVGLERQIQAAKEYEDDWRKIVRFALDSSERDVPWIKSLSSAAPIPDASKLPLLPGAIAFIAKWGEVAKGQARVGLVSGYREMLSTLDEALGLTPEKIGGCWPAVSAFIRRHNAHQELLPDEGLAKQTVDWLLSQQRRDQRVSSLFAPVIELVGNARSLAQLNDGAEKKRLDARQASIRASLLAHPKLGRMVKVYDELVRRFRKDPNVLFILDPKETGNCPRCRYSFVVSVQSALADPMSWSQCSECDVILIGAKKYLKDAKVHL